MNVTTAVAKGFIERSTKLGYKGKKLDAAMMDYFVGAADSARAIGGEDGADFKALSVMVWLVAIRGMDMVREYADRSEAKQEQAALETAAG